MENSFLSLKSISKRFGGVPANQDVSFSVQEGSIHAIVGENGAGKSTAMKILYGQYKSDSGEIIYKGKARTWNSPSDAIKAGIGMLHQHFMLSAPQTILENIVLGKHQYPWSGMGISAAKKKLLALMTEYKLEIDLDALVENCSVGIQQRVEILKLLYQNSDVLILDEPTAVLSPAEIETFFSLLREMARRGKTILIITHKLKEVMALAERVTVFRSGKVVANLEVSQTSMQDLAKSMVGQDISFDNHVNRTPSGEVMVRAENWKLKKGPKNASDLNFQIHSGEVLGIAGVEGNGQSELIQALLSPGTELLSGSYKWKNKDVRKYFQWDIRNLNFGVFPEDRIKEGIIPGASLLENFLLRWRNFPEFSFGLFLNHARIFRKVSEKLVEYDVRPRNPAAIIGDLSGGNQQKMVIARELADNPEFILAAQPTRGVDIGSVHFIHEKILEKRNSGAGVLLISSELDEVIKLSDRILVIYRSQFVAEFLRENFNEKEIGFFMMGGDKKYEN